MTALPIHIPARVVEIAAVLAPVPWDVTYIGQQADGRGGSFALYNDALAGSTFAVPPGRSVADVVRERRGAFGGAR